MRKFKRAHKLNTTRVKVVCYYSHRKDGTPYSVPEMQRSCNRAYHDMEEWIYSEHKRVIHREDLSIRKAKRHIHKWKHHIISALIFVNDWGAQVEKQIGKYHKDYGMVFNEPEYTEPDIDGNVYIKKIKSLVIDEMRTGEIEYKKIEEEI